ncbi:hypothetical protein ASC97_30765 [Rhizobium sp. Root1203]|nr:hypothetical protein ASC97_30765 [Rhizobium sp. Root1203]
MAQAGHDCLAPFKFTMPCRDIEDRMVVSACGEHRSGCYIGIGMRDQIDDRAGLGGAARYSAQTDLRPNKHQRQERRRNQATGDGTGHSGSLVASVSETERHR